MTDTHVYPAPLGSERTTLGFFADILHIQGVIPFEMYSDILESKTHEDLSVIIEKALRSEYNVFKRGKSIYVGDMV